MKIALECKDLILERALQLFLREHLSQKKDCDFIICDEKISFNKPQFIICKHSTQLDIPFNKDELFAALNDFDKALKELALQVANEKIKELEERIKNISAEFKLAYQKDLDDAISRLEERLRTAINDKIKPF